MTDEMVEKIESKVFSGDVVRLPVGHALLFFKSISERFYDRHFKVHFNQGFIFISRDDEALRGFIR